MMRVELKPLFGRLNPLCRSVLEGAAGLTLARNHYEISIEHFLYRLLDENHSDAVAILANFDIDPLKLVNQLDQSLSKFKAGNPDRPVFSGLLTELVQDAWLMASLELGYTKIRSGAVLLALIARSNYYLSGTDWGELLQQISKDALIKDFDSIVANSTEKELSTSTATATDTGSQSTEAIDRFCEDFTAKAAAGKIDPVFGRDNEIRQIIDILARRRKNNPICVGDPGVGKTAVVEGLALRIIEGDVPEFLANTRLLGLDLGLLEAGASVKGEFENRLRAVIDEVKSSVQPIILFIDEAHMLIGAGGAAGGSDAANLLKPALARGELRTIAATTWAEYKKYFERDPALTRRFQVVKLDEPSVDTTVQILRGLKDRYEAVHGVTILDEAVKAAAQLSDRYITGRLLPDKAVDLLDTAAARVRISMGVKPNGLEKINRKLLMLERERLALERDHEHGHAIETERLAEITTETAELQKQQTELHEHWQAEQQAALNLVKLRVAAASQDKPTKADLEQASTALKELQQTETLVFTEVGPDTVAQVVSDWTGVPLGKMQRDSAGDILNLAQTIKQRIKGQDLAIDQLAQVLKASQAGLRDPQQPLGVFLLVGPSGVGKTETALSIADELFGGEQSLTVINMSEFQEKHTVSRLVGSPPGYVGYGEGGVLTEAVRKKPYSVVLLDEVEKAHLDVLNMFYQVFDKGSLADGEGRLIDFSNTVIFLTSNLATDTITKATSNSSDINVDDLLALIRPELSSFFKPALLARMTIVPYQILGPDALSGIVKLKLKRLSDRLLATNKINLEFSPELIDTVVQRCSEVETGARNIDFILRKSLLPVLSDTILNALAEQQHIQSIKISTGADQDWDIQVME